jgi:hypothetical protein
VDVRWKALSVWVVRGAQTDRLRALCGHTWEPEFFEIVFSQGGDEAYDFFCGPAAFGLEIATGLGVVGLCVVDLL